MRGGRGHSWRLPPWYWTPETGLELRQSDSMAAMAPKHALPPSMRAAFGKPTITPKTPFKVKDLDGGMRLGEGLDLLRGTVDNPASAASVDVQSGRSEKSFPQYER